MRPHSVRPLLCLLLLLLLAFALEAAAESRRLLYVAAPGIRNYLEYGGHGLLVFDVDQGFRFVKRIPTGGLDDDGKPRNVKGLCASALTGRIYISTTHTLQCLDLRTEQLLWEKPYEDGCDRMALSPDGKWMYVPSFEKAQWHVVDALAGDILATVTPNSGAHNTLISLDGTRAFLAGLRSPLLSITDSATHRITQAVGPFGAPVRPFTINGRATLVFACVNELLGFEIGDVTSGKMLHRVVVEGFQKGPVKRHGCPSHGIALTPDEREVWLADGANQRLHVFDVTVMPPKQVASIALRDQPGWISFSLEGRRAYSSTGEVIDAASRRIIATLTDEARQAVHSEKLLEIELDQDGPVRAGNQFGVGQVRD
ncbi:MAG: hypothetical protein M3463_13765 [Verrucomicrobiota bacterium]|nr:hypothetical protein [Verrucomicrobiota bacterium]